MCRRHPSSASGACRMSWVTHGPVGLGADARDLHAAAGQVHQDQHGEAVGGGWGNTITALTASQTSIRGAHPARLRLDEADEMRLPILEAAQGQTMDQGAVRAQTVIASTHQHPDGTMTTVLQRAAEQGWPVYQWCWQETQGHCQSKSA